MKHKTISTSENLQILYEDNHLIIINKRPGDIVQGDKTGDTPLSELVKEYLKLKYNKPGAVFLGVVHRLDRPTSGIVIFARTSKALTRLNKSFLEKEVKKTYWAIVKTVPNPSQDTLTHWMVRNTKQNKSYAYKKEVSNAKKAILSYKLIKRLERYALLEIDLMTGRHHQIRSQLTAINSPIKGDLKYGSDRSNPDGSICLHARLLTLQHPVKKESLSITANPPDSSIWNACIQ